MWLLGFLYLQGCAFQAPQLGCQNSAQQPVVRTLSWKPTWEYSDVDMNQRGEFYFSPYEDLKGEVPFDTIFQVQLDGTRKNIKLHSDSVKPAALTGEKRVPFRSPGNLAVFGESVWVTGSTWIKSKEGGGVVPESQLIRIQPHALLSTPEIWRPAGSENAPLSPLLSLSDASLYTVLPCSILRVNRVPPFQEVFAAKSGSTRSNCLPIRLKDVAVSPAEHFYASASGTELSSSEEDQQTYKASFYQVFRIKGGNIESWAGSPEMGFKDGQRDQARFSEPMGLAVARDETVYIADRANHAIRKISPTGEVTTLVGNGQPGTADGAADVARLDSPYNVLLGPCHKLYAFDKNGIREISLPPDASAERWGDPVPFKTG